jgi:CBS domain-containing protein
MNQVADAMTRGVKTICPSDTLTQAAQAMTELDIGALPVCDGERLVGMVTDRDIVIRGVAQGRANDEACVSDVMTEEASWCRADDDIDSVLERMRSMQIRRLPVIDEDKRLVGMVSLGDIAVKAAEADVQGAMEGISEPAEPDRSGQSQASGTAGGGSASGQARRTQSPAT